MDVRPGGQWRIIQTDADGNYTRSMAFTMRYLPDERLVYTFEYEGTPGHVLLETITFSEENGLTKSA